MKVGKSWIQRKRCNASQNFRPYFSQIYHSMLIKIWWGSVKVRSTCYLPIELVIHPT